jgi:hypothetical protein
MCHTGKTGDGCFARGVGSCGGNLLQANAASSGLRGRLETLSFNAKDLGGLVRSTISIRRRISDR